MKKAKRTYALSSGEQEALISLSNNEPPQVQQQFFGFMWQPANGSPPQVNQDLPQVQQDPPQVLPDTQQVFQDPPQVAPSPPAFN